MKREDGTTVLSKAIAWLTGHNEIHMTFCSVASRVRASAGARRQKF